jgi:hypothetical protein
MQDVTILPPMPIPESVPVPMPALPAPASARSVSIPEGPPEAAALAMLASIDPTLETTTRARIDAIRAELEGLVEEARLTALPLGRFVARAAKLVKLRQILEQRLGVLAGILPAAVPPSVEVADLICSVRRWRPSHELRGERARLVKEVSGDLRAVEQDVQSLAGAVRSGAKLSLAQLPLRGDGSHDPADPSQSGLRDGSDEALRRLTAVLTTRQDLRGRLARLDGQGDGGRSEAVREVLNAAGGIDALAGLLAPSQPAPPAVHLRQMHRELASVNGKLGALDPDSQAAARLAGQRDALASRAAELEAVVITERDRSARVLLDDALGGGLAAIGRLELAVRSIRPELGDALASIRGDRDVLVAVVAEMMAS